MKRDLGSPLAPTFGGGDLKTRLAKRKMRTEAKAERKNIKSAGKNKDAKNKGYKSQADKNRMNVNAAVKIRKSRVTKERKGPKNVSTSTSTSTSNRGGDRNKKTVTVNKNKSVTKNKPSKKTYKDGSSKKGDYSAGPFKRL